MIRARMIDGGGTLSVLAARARAGRMEALPVGPWVRAGFQLHASQPEDLVTIAARKLVDGGTVGLFDGEGLTANLMDRIEGIAAAMRALEGHARRFEWTHGPLAETQIEGERGAIEWFIRSPTDMLIVGPVAFEKRTQPQTHGGFRRRRTSITPGRGTARAA